MVAQPSTEILCWISVAVVACTDSWELKKKHGDQQLRDSGTLCCLLMIFFGCF